MFKVKYVDSIMMLVRLDLNLIVSLFQHKCEVSEMVSTTTLICPVNLLFIATFMNVSQFLFEHRVDSTPSETSLRVGDRILEVNGTPVRTQNLHEVGIKTVAK